MQKVWAVENQKSGKWYTADPAKLWSDDWWERKLIPDYDRADEIARTTSLEGVVIAVTSHRKPRPVSDPIAMKFEFNLS